MKTSFTSFVIPACLALASCATATDTNTYTVVARDSAAGKDIPGPSYTALGGGRAIYTIRNALCSAHPGAVVIITNQKTGEELKSESPYKCR